MKYQISPEGLARGTEAIVACLALPDWDRQMRGKAARAWMEVMLQNGLIEILKAGRPDALAGEQAP